MKRFCSPDFILSPHFRPNININERFNRAIVNDSTIVVCTGIVRFRLDPPTRLFPISRFDRRCLRLQEQRKRFPYTETFSRVPSDAILRGLTEEPPSLFV